MKKLFTFCLCVLMLCLSTSLADSEVTLNDIKSVDEYYVKLTRKLRVEVKNNYYIQQGSATDGEYGYFLVESRADLKCAIYKIDMSNYKIVNQVYDVPVEHGNGMAFNPHTNQFVVVHCKPTSNRLSFIDRDTLSVIDTLDMPIEMASIAYNANRDQYVIGHYGNRHFSILDNEFNILHTYETAEGTINNQDADCDDKYIYLLEWDSAKENANSIVIYDWEGNFVNQITVKSLNEIESMFHIGDQVVLAFYSRQCDIQEARILRLEQ